MRLKALLLGAAFAASVVSAPAFATEYLANGSFETGDFSGWNWSGNTNYTSIASGGAQDGIYRVEEGPVGSYGLLSQTFSDTAGQALNISGWVNGEPDNGSAPSAVELFFNGVSVAYISPVETNGWLNLTATVTATGNDTFTVGFHNDPAYNSLDNFSVTSGAAPEPSTWAMMGLGFAGLAFAGYRSRRSKAAIA